MSSPSAATSAAATAQPAPSEFISADNRSPLINLVTWVTMTIACLAAITKIFTKWAIMRRQDMDDAYMAAALVVTIAFDVAISIATSYGIGQHTDTITLSSFANLEKALYVAEILYVISVCLSKMPILHFLLSLARQDMRRRAIYVVMLFNVITMIVGVFVIAFQCSMPDAWAILISSRCINRNAFWDFYGSMDTLVDLAIVALPIYLLHDLHIQRKKKVSAMAAFAVRLITVPLAIIRLVFLDSAASLSATDPAFAYSKTIIVTSVHANISIIAACIPFFKPVMDAMQSGVMNLDLRGFNPSSGGGLAYAPSGARLQNLRSGPTASTNSTSGKRASSRANYWDGKHWPQTNVFARAGSGNGKGGPYAAGEDGVPRSSTESRQKMIIKAETTIQVLSEEDPNVARGVSRGDSL